MYSLQYYGILCTYSLWILQTRGGDCRATSCDVLLTISLHSSCWTSSDTFMTFLPTKYDIYANKDSSNCFLLHHEEFVKIMLHFRMLHNCSFL